MLHGFPEYDPDGDGYIQGMFGAILRYFNGSVADIEGFLTDTMDLVAENECNGLTPTEWKRLQGYASRHLFDCPYAVSVLCISAEGGLPVMPHKHTECIRNASEVRRVLPTLWRLRTLSSMTTRGSFSAFLNSVGSRRCISSMVSLCMLFWFY